ncbi:MAG: cytochrome P450, partial [Luminiphilus sp.]|nr:cytochrome P450 [Luminiphilus sp.]
ALTWVFYLLAVQPDLVSRLRAEVLDVVGDDPIHFSHVKKLPLVRAVFRETLRLYPPITFIPRVALEDCNVGERRLRRGALVMISPWTLHRHQRYWDRPSAFIPERFLGEGESSIQEGTYIPFGVGPHTCIGAGFAQAEAVLIIAETVRRFDFRRADNRPVRPAARLTTRPAEQIRLHCRHP